MLNEVIKKLWVSCHLLYPNSSQARDIFNIVIEPNFDQVSNRQDQIQLGLGYLYKAYKKRKPVHSGSANFEFSNLVFNKWKRVFQKCNQDEVFILMAVLQDLAHFKDLSEIMKIPEAKIKYLFNQGFKKVIQSPALRFEQKKETKLKTYGSNDVSHLFVSEYLIEYILGLSDPEITKKLDQKLIENNRFNDYKNEVLGLKFEIIDLPVSEHLQEGLKSLNNPAQLESLKKIDLRQKKSLAVASIFMMILVAGLILRPKIFWPSQSSADNQSKIVLQEVEFKKNNEPAVNSEMIEPMTTAKTDEVSKTLQVAQTIVVSAAPVVKNIRQKGPTGLYRGSITVTDFEQITAMIRERVIMIGGKKAGEVELGWTKNQKTSYFHFVFPSEKLEELVNFVEQYGKLKYKFESHPRVLPVGQARFILEVNKGE